MWLDWLAPMLDPGSRTFAGALAAAAAVALVVGCVQQRAWPHRVAARGLSALFDQLRTRSSLLDAQLLIARQALRILGALPVLGASLFAAQWAVRGLDRVAGRPDLGVDPAAVTALYTLTLFIAWDASRFAVHQAMHRVPALWAFHQVHHSAEVLTPLTFHRVHPVESALYQLRGAIVTTAVLVPFFWLFREGVDPWTVLGVHGLGFVFNGLTGNLRHSHVWLRFGATVERWLISPAQHQIHHSADPRHFDRNFGTWLAVWDRLAGTLVIADAHAPTRFGLDAPNHGQTLLSAWFGPFRALLPRRLPAPATAVLLLPWLPIPEAAAEDDSDGEVIVEAEAGVPTVAGSAHVLSEADLERMQHTDVQRMLVEVPGVNLRDEDGFGLRPNIGIRGAASERSAKVTLLEDGIPFAPAPYAAPAAYYFPLAVRMAGIEVFKGPAATQHGPNTIGGAINLRTREVPREGPAAYVDGAVGSFGANRLHTWVGTGTERAGLLLEGVQLGSNGFKTLPDDSLTGFDRSELMAKGRLVVRDSAVAHDTLQLKLGYSRERSHETYLGLHRDDWAQGPLNRYAASALGEMRWNRTQAEATWIHRRQRRLTVRTTAYHHYLQRAWRKFNRFGDGPSPHEILRSPDSGINAVYLALLRGDANSSTSGEQLLIGTNDRRYHSTGVQSLARFQVGDPEGIQARGEVGLRLHHDHVVRRHTEDAHDMVDGILVRDDSPTAITTDRVSTATALAAHTHWDVQLSRLHLEPGLRVEAVRTAAVDAGDSDPAPAQSRLYVMPGIGALVNMGRFVDVFAGAHRGFSPVAPGQPRSTQAEQAINYELGTRLSRYGLQADAAVFVSDYRNLVGQCSIAGGCEGEQVDRQYNAGAVLAAGFEASVRHDVPLSPALSLPLSASYTLSHNRFKESFASDFPQFGNVLAGDAMPYVPAHQGAFGAGLTHEQASVNLGAELRSGMFDAAADPSRQDPEVPPLALLHAAAQAHVSGPVWLTLSVHNLTNASTIVSWRPAGIRPTAPRQITVGLRVR